MTELQPTETAQSPTRESILAASERLFAKEGFAAVSTRRIATDVGVNIATLNYHFGSKDGLYREAMRRAYQSLQRAIESRVPMLMELSLREILAELYAMSREHADAVRLFMREVMDFGHLREETQAEHWLPSIERYSAVVAASLAIDEMRCRQALVTVSFLIARFAIQSPPSLRAAFGCADDDQATAAVIDCLFLTTRTFLEEKQ
jgi:AcrR family transcriptional regulator